MIVVQFQVLVIQGAVEGDATRKQIVREISPGRASQDQKISEMIRGSGPRITTRSYRRVPPSLFPYQLTSNQLDSRLAPRDSLPLQHAGRYQAHPPAALLSDQAMSTSVRPDPVSDSLSNDACSTASGRRARTRNRVYRCGAIQTANASQLEAFSRFSSGGGSGYDLFIGRGRT